MARFFGGGERDKLTVVLCVHYFERNGNAQGGEILLCLREKAPEGSSSKQLSFEIQFCGKK